MPNRTDGNTREIVSEVIRQGWQWLDTHDLGCGFPDGIAVRLTADGWEAVFVEIKNGAQSRLTQREVEFHNRYPGLVEVWRTVEDVRNGLSDDMGSR